MSLERYFQRAQDEARRLLADVWWLRREPSLVHWPNRWRAAVDVDGEVRSAEYVSKSPVRSSSLGRVVGSAWLGPFGLARVLGRAMVDTDGSPTLAAGEGAEARRLLEMVAWDRVPQKRWPEVFERLRLAVGQRGCGFDQWEGWLSRWLVMEGVATTAKRCAA